MFNTTTGRRAIKSMQVWSHLLSGLQLVEQAENPKGVESIAIHPLVNIMDIDF